MRSYLDALVARGDFADYFTDDVTWTIIGTDQQVQGREPVRDFFTWMHTQAFDAYPKVNTLVVGDGQTTLEANLVGTHTGEFLGIPATGRRSRSPTAWSMTCGTARLRPCAPTSPWTCLPTSSNDQACRGPFHDIAGLGSGDPCS